MNIGYLAASQATRAGRAPHSQCCAPLARTLHVTCRGLLRLRGAQRPYVQLDNASRCILLSLHCVLSLLPRVSDGHPQASARGGLSVERPLHSCMPCSFRCSLYLSLFRLRLPEYTVLLFFCARRLGVLTSACSPFVVPSPSRESFGLSFATCSTTLNSVQPRRCSQRSRTAVLRVQLRWTFVKHACGKL